MLLEGRGTLITTKNRSETLLPAKMTKELITAQSKERSEKREMSQE